MPADLVANQRLRLLDCSPLILNFNLQRHRNYLNSSNAQSSKIQLTLVVLQMQIFWHISSKLFGACLLYCSQFFTFPDYSPSCTSCSNMQISAVFSSPKDKTPAAELLSNRDSSEILPPTILNWQAVSSKSIIPLKRL